MPASMASMHGVLGERRRHEGDRDVGAGLGHRLLDGAEHRQLACAAAARRVVPGLAGVDAADDLGTGLEHQGGVLGALPPVMPWTMTLESLFR